MFSWSNGNGTTTKSSASNNYPGRRAGAARAVEGSIRPPSSASSGNGKVHTRAQHLQSYLEDATLQRSTRRVSSDDTTYDTVFQTTKGDTLILRVNVPLKSSFAAFCPAMTLAGVKVRHPWVDSSNPRTMRITGYDPIQSEQAWKDSGMMLGDAVHAVVKHLQLNPPQLVEITDKGLQSLNGNKQQPSGSGRNRSGSRSPPRSGNGASMGTSSNHDAPPGYHVVAETTTSTPAPEVPMPAIPSTFAEVKDLDRAELDELMDDELEFLSLVHKLKVFDQIFSVGSSRLNENVALANENLAKEEQWKTLSAEVKELQETLKSKVSYFNKLEEKQNAICAPPDLASTLRKLNQAKKVAFDESEKLAEDWVEDGGNVDEFLKSFLEQRTIHHLRAAKAEIVKHSNI